MSSFFRGIAVGLILPLAVGMPLAAFGLQYVPDSALFGNFARILESVAPQLLLAALLPVALLALAGARRTAAACLALVLLSGAGLVLQQVRVAEPLVPAERADLRLLWFNANAWNRTPAATVFDEICAADADLVILAESAKYGPKAAALADLYPYRAGCAGACEITILSRHPLGDLKFFPPGIAWEDRLALFTLALPGHAPVTFVALHMSKPWFYGIIDREIETIETELPRHAGPMVLVGDLNAAPWSRRLHWLRDVAGLKPTRTPVPTWPASAGAAGIPIDHVLVRGGPRVVSIEPWGMDLASDHRGLLVTLSLPPAG